RSMVLQIHINILFKSSGITKKLLQKAFGVLQKAFGAI
ncbi:MAG: hypothetical protein RIS64_4424, partial [Bacteroidota bacterium]